MTKTVFSEEAQNRVLPFLRGAFAAEVLAERLNYVPTHRKESTSARAMNVASGLLNFKYEELDLKALNGFDGDVVGLIRATYETHKESIAALTSETDASLRTLAQPETPVLES